MAKKVARFIALDEKPPELKAVPCKDEYYCPTVHLNRTIPGLEKPGEEKVVKVRVRVSSVEKRKGGRGGTGLDLLAIEAEG